MTNQTNDIPEGRAFVRPEGVDAFRPLVLRGLRRRRMAAVGVVILTGYATAFLWAAAREIDLLEALRGDGLWLAALPAVFLVLMAVTVAEMSARDQVRKAGENRFVVTDLALFVVTRGRRSRVPWKAIRRVDAVSVLGKPTVFVSWSGGKTSFDTTLVEHSDNLPQGVATVFGLRFRKPDGSLHDPRRTKAANHPLVQAIVSRTGLELE